ncbi:MAG: PorT family protein [Saprospiraceae bacterium]|nr:PorT family protein [Saprospiraceae bacterium]
MKRTTILLLLLTLSYGVFAQLADEDAFYFGFKVGASKSDISNVKQTIIRDFFPESTYSTLDESAYGGLGGMFFYYRFPGSFLALQPELVYAQGGSKFSYQDINDLTYRMNFEYQYFQLSTLLKVYPLADYSEVLAGLNIFLGPQFSANVASEKITYTSNSDVNGQDLQIQQNLRGVLKGSSDFMLVGGIGFEIGRFIFDARYNLGLKDNIETMANGYNFIENKNSGKSIQVSIGYAIPFDQF